VWEARLGRRDRASSELRLRDDEGAARRYLGWMNDLLSRLEDWYRAQCDGEWEHDFGIQLESLDNPGWWLRVDLAATPFENRPLEARTIERSERDWVQVKLEDGRFHAAGGPGNLTEILTAFLDWVGSDAPGRPE